LLWKNNAAQPIAGAKAKSAKIPRDPLFGRYLAAIWIEPASVFSHMAMPRHPATARRDLEALACQALRHIGLNGL